MCADSELSGRQESVPNSVKLCTVPKTFNDLTGIFFFDTGYDFRLSFMVKSDQNSVLTKYYSKVSGTGVQMNVKTCRLDFLVLIFRANICIYHPETESLTVATLSIIAKMFTYFLSLPKS